MSDGLLEWVLVVAIASPIVAYAIGGVMHIAIDAVHGRRLLRRYWDATDAKVAKIRADVVEDLRLQLDELKAAVPPAPDLQSLQERLEARMDELAADPIPENALEAAFERFLRSPAGVTWAAELGNLAADKVLEGVRNLTTSKEGARVRTQQSLLLRELAGAIDFGNPVMNGAWQMLGGPRQQAVFVRISRVLRAHGLALVRVTDTTARPAEDGGFEEMLQLGAGETTQGQFDDSAWRR
jgi:hypothetical protein